MKKNRRFHTPSPAFIVALVALIVALGGTSYAALRLPVGSVGTAQLRAGAVTGKKVRAHSLVASDFKSGQLPRGVRGSRGPQGPAGLPGPRGQSALDPIAPGRTVTGHFVYDGNSPTGVTSDYAQYVALPAPARAPLTDEQVNFAPANGVIDGDVECTGTRTNPTAPPGKVCLYLGGHATDLRIEGAALEGGGSSDAFEVRWLDDGTDDDSFLWGTWAYTAPATS